MCWKLAWCPKYAVRIAFWNLSSSCNDEFRNLPFSRVTFGKSFWRCAARTDQKKCLFPTGRFQTWPLKSIPVFRPIKQWSQTRHKWTGIKLISSLLWSECPQKKFLQTISNSPYYSVASSHTIVWYDFYGRCCDTLPFSLRPLDSMEI